MGADPAGGERSAVNDEPYDAVLVGSGINSLIAGAMLAEAGWRVLICERSARAGGAIRTSTDVAPGFTIDLMANVFPDALRTVLAQNLPSLEARGVKFLVSDAPMGVVCAAGSTLLAGDPFNMALTMGALGDLEGWRTQILAGDTSGEPWELGQETARTWLDRSFTSPITRALLAPWGSRYGFGPDDPYGAEWTVNLARMALRGISVHEGGGTRLIDALVQTITDAGGTLLLRAHVSRVIVAGGRAVGVELADGSRHRAQRAVLAAVTPQALYGDLLAEVDIPSDIRSSTEEFDYGRACMQIHVAMAEKPIWLADARLASAAVVHVLDDIDALAESIDDAEHGILPARPQLTVKQPSTMDPSRAPEGGAVMCIQITDLPTTIRSDSLGEIEAGGTSWTPRVRDAYAERIMSRLELLVPNIRSEAARELVLGPANFHSMNVNLVGGDPYAGDTRRYRRDAADSAGPVATCVEGLWHIGSSAGAGMGLAGQSGLLAARACLAACEPR